MHVKKTHLIVSLLVLMAGIASLGFSTRGKGGFGIYGTNIVYITNYTYEKPDSETEKEILLEKTRLILEENYEMTTQKEEELPIIIDSVYDYACNEGIDPELILSMIYVESRFNRFEKSSAEALGLMQVIEKWETDFMLANNITNLYEIDGNIQTGVNEFSGYLEEKDSVMKSLYRYNGMYITYYDNTVAISKESYFYGIRVMDIYYQYKNLSYTDLNDILS